MNRLANRYETRLFRLEKEKVEASPGIEPGCKDLQSSA